jgi:hypothetical protein
MAGIVIKAELSIVNTSLAHIGVLPMRVPVVLSLLAVWAFPAAGGPRLRCTLDQGGTSQVIEVGPVTDPYSVEAIDINGRFRFKAVVIGDAQLIQYIKLYTYYQTARRWVLLHEANYLAPRVQPASSSAALTGRHSLYAPGREREFQYGCALVEANP